MVIETIVAKYTFGRKKQVGYHLYRGEKKKKQMFSKYELLVGAIGIVIDLKCKCTLYLMSYIYESYCD